MGKVDMERVAGCLNGVALITQPDLGTQVIVQGYADFEKEIKHTINSKFLICSVSKMFVSVVINQLCETGLLDKGDLLRKYIPEYFKEHQVTLYQLLTHTSGLPNYVAYKKELDWNSTHTADEIMSAMDKKPLQFKPGTKWRYSNTGYYLLALIIERITGMKYETYIQKHIFDTLKMKDSSFEVQGKVKLVRAHLKGKRTEPIHSSLLFGAGDVISTAKDLSLFGKALMEGRLVSKETLKQMGTPVFPNSKMKYGEGLFVNDHFDTLQIGHGGSMPGYATQLSIYPEKQVVSVILTNNQKMIHPLVYPDLNSRYIESCLTEQVFNKKVNLIKKIYL